MVFKIKKVVKIVKIEEKLVERPSDSYDLEIGKLNKINLGLFQGDNIERVFPSYEIQSTSNQTLESQFTV